MILIIDNYDSFTYNIVQYISQHTHSFRVIKNDQYTVEDIELMKPNGIVISPGPSVPSKAGICLEVVRHFHERIPILGICLGHQVIAEAFHGKVVKAEIIVHGKTDSVAHDGQGLFQNTRNPLVATRYHSLIVEKKSLPEVFVVTASAESDQVIMGIRHRTYPVEGFQFHPESYGSEDGNIIISNFVQSIEKELNNDL